ncbi:MAG: GNAT family N-acetyltransferase, partial [Ruminococcus sp.]|nr:GNAT family N-acetyltransferase [Ruminococcus sp.]
MIREIKNDDLRGLLELYTHLHEKEVPEIGEKVLGIWDTIMNDPNHHIIVAEEDGRIVSSCVCLIIPNLTRGLKPHAFIENVVTDSAYRKRGLATACLNYAKEIAEREGCYKLLLATGSKEESTLRFYERAGYNK